MNYGFVIKETRQNEVETEIVWHLRKSISHVQARGTCADMGTIVSG